MCVCVGVLKDLKSKFKTPTLDSRRIFVCIHTLNGCESRELKCKSFASNTVFSHPFVVPPKFEPFNFVFKVIMDIINNAPISSASNNLKVVTITA